MMFAAMALPTKVATAAPSAPYGGTSRRTATALTAAPTVRDKLRSPGRPLALNPAPANDAGLHRTMHAIRISVIGNAPSNCGPKITGIAHGQAAAIASHRYTRYALERFALQSGL